MLFWIFILVVVGVVVALVLDLKTTRPDGDLVRVHPYRRVLGFLMPSPSEAVVYFDSYVDATKLLEYLDEVAAGGRFEARITHAVVAAVNKGIHDHPSMNRFLKGYRLYARRGRWISFSAKKKRKDKKAALAAVKLEMLDGESFKDLCDRTNATINRERSGKPTGQDKEMDLLDKVPRPVFALAVRLLQMVDYYNLMPGWYIKDDPMYSSIFIANLGSLDMAAGYHHLYRWGTAPIFLMVGKVEERPWVVDGEVVVRPVLHLRWTYDEHIDDGMTAGIGVQVVLNVLRNPHATLGCLAEDGSDDHSMVD